MTAYRRSNHLLDTYGEHVILTDEGQNEEHYRVLMEMAIGGQPYAVLQLHGDPLEEAYVFRVTPKEEGYIVEDVEEEGEWDAVVEAYCRIVCGS